MPGVSIRIGQVGANRAQFVESYLERVYMRGGWPTSRLEYDALSWIVRRESKEGALLLAVFEKWEQCRRQLGGFVEEESLAIFG